MSGLQLHSCCYEVWLRSTCSVQLCATVEIFTFNFFKSADFESAKLISVIMDMATPGGSISGKEERIDQQDGCLLRLHDDQVVVGQVLLDKEEKEEEERWEQIGRGMHHLNVLMQGFVQTKMQEHLAKLPRFYNQNLCDVI